LAKEEVPTATPPFKNTALIPFFVQSGIDSIAVFKVEKLVLMSVAFNV
jgi:hypothetical protein